MREVMKTHAEMEVIRSMRAMSGEAVGGDGGGSGGGGQPGLLIDDVCDAAAGDCSLLGIAAKRGHYKVVELLLTMFKEEKSLTDPGWVPGDKVAYKNTNGTTEDVEIVKVHREDVELYYTIHIPSTDRERQTTLDKLSDGAADATMGAGGGDTVADEAMAKVKKQVWRQVLQIDVNKRFRFNNADGWTAFAVAALCGHADVAELLRRNGANPLMGTSFHATSFAVAESTAQQHDEKTREAMAMVMQEYSTLCDRPRVPTLLLQEAREAKRLELTAGGYSDYDNNNYTAVPKSKARLAIAHAQELDATLNEVGGEKPIGEESTEAEAAIVIERQCLSHRKEPRDSCFFALKYTGSYMSAEDAAAMVAAVAASTAVAAAAWADMQTLSSSEEAPVVGASPEVIDITSDEEDDVVCITEGGKEGTGPNDVPRFPVLTQALRLAMMGKHAVAAGIVDVTLASLKVFAANKMRNWQEADHPLVNGSPMYEEVKCLLSNVQ
jgi:hypothetical protein